MKVKKVVTDGEARAEERLVTAKEEEQLALVMRKSVKLFYLGINEDGGSDEEE